MIIPSHNNQKNKTYQLKLYLFGKIEKASFNKQEILQKKCF